MTCEPLVLAYPAETRPAGGTPARGKMTAG
jgi:hypothetical protein